MKYTKMIFIGLLLPFTIQCSDSSQSVNSTAKKPMIFQHQVNALNKAKQLNQKVLNATKRTRQHIELQSQ